MPSPITVVTTDGYSLSATVFEPIKDNGRVVLINSAMAVKQAYYADFAQYLAEQGFMAVTYDYRGIGQSKPMRLKGFSASARDWMTHDQTALIEWCVQTYSNARLLVVGHSFGGQIPALSPAYAHITGLLTIASQSGYWRLWNGTWRLWMALLGYVLLPYLRFLYGYFPGKRLGMGNDFPAKVAQEWGAGIRARRYFLDVFGQESFNHFAHFQAPIRSIHFSDDAYAPRSAVEALLGFYTQTPTELISVTPASVGIQSIGHFGFFRQLKGSLIWQDCVDWLLRV